MVFELHTSDMELFSVPIAMCHCCTEYAAHRTSIFGLSEESDESDDHHIS